MSQKGNIALIPLMLILLLIAAYLIYSKTNLSQRSSSVTTIQPQSSYQNPFDKTTQYTNPFSQYKNPFDNLQ